MRSSRTPIAPPFTPPTYVAISIGLGGLAKFCVELCDGTHLSFSKENPEQMGVMPVMKLARNRFFPIHLRAPSLGVRRGQDRVFQMPNDRVQRINQLGFPRACSEHECEPNKPKTATYYSSPTLLLPRGLNERRSTPPNKMIVSS